MTNLYAGLHRGPIDHEGSSTINYIANEAIAMGSSVSLVAAPATELLPRVEEGDAANEALYGVVVAGDADGIYGTGAAPTDDTTRAATAAGEAVVVCTQGRCPARVDGSGTAILLGDQLVQGATAGVLVKAPATTTLSEIIGVALQASSAVDIIAIDVQRSKQNV